VVRLNEIEAYFPSKDAADRCQRALLPLFESQGPEPGHLVNGRPWRLTIRTPDSLTPSPMFIDPDVMARVLSMVMQYNGTTSIP
jgi:hypothetical protein